MEIQNIPEIYIKSENKTPDLFVYDFKMTDEVVKSKVNLGLHMFSFLQTGKKKVHFAGTSIAVSKAQSILIKKGNCLWTELLDKASTYYCKLLFFSEKRLQNFLKKYGKNNLATKKGMSFFVIQNDNYILSYLNSLSSVNSTEPAFLDHFLSVKFEELMLYLINKYGDNFELYLHSLISKKQSSFNNIIENSIYTNLKLEEIAFLCNMSLSTFKRKFIKEYKVSPGKWFQDKKLNKAKKMLENKEAKPSNLYYELGYSNLSNFSIAYKNKFGKSPRNA